VDTKVDPTEIDSASDAPEQGSDELNLAEFPLAALSRRAAPGSKTLVFQDTVRHAKREVLRKLTVTGSDLHGLPTSRDEDVLVGLIAVSKAQGFVERVVPFTRSALLKLLGWSDNGQSYERLSGAFRRWHGVTLQYERAWWDREARCFVDASFHVLESFTLPGRRGPGDVRPRGELLCTFTWNDFLLRSFRSGNVKRLNLALYFDLTLAPARRMYRYLDKHFWHASRLEFDLKAFATQHVGLSPGYGDAGKLKEKLSPSIEELERAGFLVPLNRDKRYVRLGRGNWRIVFERPGGALRQEAEASAEDSDLAPELMARGVSARAAVELTLRFPPERIRGRITAFDALCRAGALRIKNPPGYLISSIRDDYGATRGRPPPPPSRAVRAKAPASSEPEQEPSVAARYLEGVPPAERERLTRDALAAAKPLILAHYERHKDTRPDLAGQFLQVIVERHVEGLFAQNPSLRPASSKQSPTMKVST
jgi:hypothetical protein